jgi:hypothetical protein
LKALVAEALRLIFPWLSRGHVAHLALLVRLFETRGEADLLDLVLCDEVFDDLLECEPEEDLRCAKESAGVASTRHKITSASFFMTVSGWR